MDINDRFRLDRRAALVTGAGCCIGRACAIALAHAAAEVWLPARTDSEVHQVAGEIRAAAGRAWARACDITNSKDFQKLVSLIHVLSVAPTFIETPMFKRMTEANRDFLTWVKDRIPAGIVGKTGRRRERGGELGYGDELGCGRGWTAQ